MPALPLADLLKAELAARLAPGAGTFLDLFAEDAVLECPFAPPGSMHRVSGKKEIAAYLDQIKDSLGSDGMTLSAAFHTVDAEAAILEYSGTASNVRNGKHYAQRYIAVVKLREGRIVLFREYWNPLPVVDAFGALPFAPSRADPA